LIGQLLLLLVYLFILTTENVPASSMPDADALPVGFIIIFSTVKIYARNIGQRNCLLARTNSFSYHQ